MLSDEQQRNFSDFMAVLDSVEHEPIEVLRYCLDQWLALCYLSGDRVAHIHEDRLNLRGDTDFARLSEAATSILHEYLRKLLPAFLDQHKPHEPLLLFPDEYSGLVSDSTDSCAVLGLIAIEHRLIALSLALIDLFHALKAEAVLIKAAWSA